MAGFGGGGGLGVSAGTGGIREGSGLGSGMGGGSGYGYGTGVGSPVNPGQSDILRLLQGASGAPQGGSRAPSNAFVPPPVPSPVATRLAAPVVNTAQANPQASRIADKLENRASGTAGLSRGVQDIRNNALAGIAGDRLSRVARGVNGTGIDTFDANRQADQQRGDINRLTSDFKIADEAATDFRLGAAAGLALNTSGQQLQAQGQNTAAAQGQQSLGLQAQAQANQQQNEAWRMNLEAQAAQRNAQQQTFQTLLNFLT